jgi:putative restriction endonuclease
VLESFFWEEDVWQEFANSPERLAYESAKLMAAREGRPLIDPDVEDDKGAEGLDREAIVKLRVNQSFFRKRVLSAYSNTCCVTGLSYAPLLIASHIIPWAKDVANRLNPRNGLCLNALHDKAFDRGFMWIESDLTIRMSPRLFEPEEDSDGANWLKEFDGAPLCLPKHFSPDLDLLQRHAEQAKASN